MLKARLRNLQVIVTLAATAFLVACGDDEPTPEPMPTGNAESFSLSAVAEGNVSGTITFEELDDASTKVMIQLSGTASGETHPTHIHDNTAAEGGAIAISLTAVDGASGESETIVTAKDDGTAISFEELVAYDGYVNVHKSESDLATLVVQGDIGINALTGDTKVYDLGSVSGDASGTATFAKRVSNETLVTVSLMNDEDGDHPMHIHNNTAAEGGAIAITLSNVVNGMSKTNVAATDDGTAITYDALVEYDGYINVHKSSDDLATLTAQGDIGINVLTGTMMEYDLGSVSDPDISGTIKFMERASSETLVVVNLANDADGDHPMHIHDNTAAEGGGIAVTLNNVVDGESKTNVAAKDDGTAITYDELIEYDGYLNVHLGVDALATLVAQGDIGQNALTGEMKVYDLAAVSNPLIEGSATFFQRVNSETLVVVELANDVGGDHPMHIHDNTAAEGGGIAITLNSVVNGVSKTNVAAKDDDMAVTYEQLLEYDGYINVHASVNDLATLVAQGDIGQNDLTGNSQSYALLEKDVAGISGTATFHERVNSETLVVIELVGQITGDHPMHIHEGSAADAPGAILVTLVSVNANGSSKSNVTMDDSENTLTYSDMTSIDGYINVHSSAEDLATLIAQGNVGANASN